MSDTSGAAPPPTVDPRVASRVMLYGAIFASLIILGGYVAIAILLFFKEIPAKSETIATLMFGGLNSLATLAAGYWLGSSSSSAARAATATSPPPVKAPGAP